MLAGHFNVCTKFHSEVGHTFLVSGSCSTDGDLDLFDFKSTEFLVTHFTFTSILGFSCLLIL